MLKVRPHTKSGGKGGGGGSPLQVPYTKSGGGRGQSTSGPIYDIRKVGGGGGSPHQVRYTIYEKWGGGGAVHIRSDIRYTKSGGGGGGGGGGAIRFRSDTKSGGGPVRFRSDTFVWHTENTLSLIINGYNFDQGGGGAQALHTRARMNLIVVFNCIHSLIVFILETEGGARAP